MPKQKDDHLGLWKLVETTDPKYTTKVNQRGGFTAIGAQYQLRKATELFGPFGAGWGVEEEVIEKWEDVGLAVYRATLWYKFDSGAVGSIPIHSSIKYHNNGRVDDDFMKKVATDALTKGLSKLGFNADVFMGRFDDNKYVNQLKKDFSSNGHDKDWLKKVRSAMEGLSDEDVSMVEDAISNGKITSSNFGKTIDRINELKAAKINGED